MSLWFVCWVGLAGVPAVFPEAPDASSREGGVVPALTPYTSLDLERTYRFLRQKGPKRGAFARRSLWLSPSTDVPHLWTARRRQAALGVTRWYFAQCNIQLKVAPVRVLPAGALSQGKLLRTRLDRRLLRRSHREETLLFFTQDVRLRFGRKGKIRNLLGLSWWARVRDQRGRWSRRRAIWVRQTSVYSTLAHELGHRLGLGHVRSPYNLMLTGEGVRASFANLWTSLLGYFDPRRFHFTRRQCQKMHRVLRQAQRRRAKERRRQGKKQARQGKKRSSPLLRPVGPLSPPVLLLPRSASPSSRRTSSRPSSRPLPPSR